MIANPHDHNLLKNKDHNKEAFKTLIIVNLYGIFSPVILVGFLLYIVFFFMLIGWILGNNLTNKIFGTKKKLNPWEN